MGPAFGKRGVPQQPMGPAFGKRGAPQQPMGPAFGEQGMPSILPNVYKEGGRIDMAQDKAMIKKAMGQHDAQEHQGGKGTKLALKNGGSFANTRMSDAETTPHQGVTKSNAGGYKKGGSLKKAFATGGSVDSGAPVAMARKPTSQPVSNTAQAGVFKQGGGVSKWADGGALGGRGYREPVMDRSNGAYDRAIGPSDDDMDMAQSIRNAPGSAYEAMKRMLAGAPSAGAGRGFVNPPMARPVVRKADGGSLNTPGMLQQSPPSVLPGAMPGGVPNTMPDQSLPPLAAQEAMQKALGSGENAYKRGGRVHRVYSTQMNKPLRLKF